MHITFRLIYADGVSRKTVFLRAGISESTTYRACSDSRHGRTSVSVALSVLYIRPSEMRSVIMPEEKMTSERGDERIVSATLVLFSTVVSYFSFKAQ